MADDRLRRATLWTLASRAVPLLSGPVHVVVVAATLGPAEQGLYFAAAALVRWQSALELGLGSALQQRVSAHAGRRDQASDGQLAGLLRAGVRAHLVVAGAWLVLAPVGGGVWLASSGTAAWGPWLALSVVVGVGLPLLAAFAFLEGLGRVEATYRFRAVQSVWTRAAHWLALGLGAGVWSLAVERLVGLVHGIVWLLGREGAPAREAARMAPAPVRWRTEIWPLQRGIALSNAGALVPFALLVPATYAFAGPVDAGRLGLTMALLSALYSAAYALVVPHVPELSMQAARGEAEAMGARWLRVSAQAVAAYTIAAGLVCVGLAVASTAAWPYADRFLGPLGAGLVAGALALNLLRTLLVVHTRAWQRELLWPVNLAEGAVGLVAIPLAAGVGVGAVTGVWCAGNAIALVAAVALWRRWQAEELALQ